jgi:two-component system response regulator RegX3
MDAEMAEDFPRTRALLIEDDAENRQNVRLQLEAMGILVYDTANYFEAIEAFKTRGFQVILLHLGSEPLRGLELCRTFRAESNVPIIAMTDRVDVITEQMWIAAGADDYIAQPVDRNLLVSRVTQQLRRGESQQQPAAEVLQWGSLKMDLAMHQFSVDGKTVNLTNTEFRILQLLLERPLQVFSREQILQAIGTARGPSAPNVIDTHASRIRAKIRDVGGPPVIRVIRSVGFRLAPEASS